MTDTSLSVEAAVGLLDAKPSDDAARDDAPATVAGAADDVAIEDQDQPADQTPADRDGEPDEQANPDDADRDGDEPAEKPAIEAPNFWAAEAKARFAELPADLQQVVLQQEKTREGAVTKAQQDAAEARKKADAEFGNVSQVAQAMQQWLPQAVETFKSRWEGIDWAKWAEQDPTAAFQGKLQHDAEIEQLQRVQAAKQEADKAQRQRSTQAEEQQLKTLAPQLADPKDGPKHRQDLAEYLVKQGVPADQLSDISAVAASLAFKAMQYDRAQAGLKNAPPRMGATPQKPLRPSAAQPGPSSQRDSDRVNNRFAQTRSIDDAIAVLTARNPT